MRQACEWGICVCGDWRADPFSTVVVLAFLTLRPFDTVSPVVVTPSDTIIFVASHNCNFATVLNLCFPMVLDEPRTNP